MNFMYFCRQTRVLVIALLIGLMSACSGGGGGSDRAANNADNPLTLPDDQNDSGNDGAGDDNGNGDDSEGEGNGGGVQAPGNPSYFVSLSTSEVDIELAYAWGEANGEATVLVDYRGDGIVVGYAPGSDVEDLHIQVDEYEKGKAQIYMFLRGNTRFSVGVNAVVLRVMTGDIDSGDIAYQDLTVNLVQLDGLDIEHVFVDGDAIASFEVTTERYEWSITANVPWVSFVPASGIGRADITVNYDYSQAPPGETEIDIVVEGVLPSNGETTSISRTSIANNGIKLPHDIFDDLEVHGIWGSMPTDVGVLNIETALSDWEISSTIPGLVFEPASGSGSAFVSITYNNDIAVGWQEGTVTVSAQGRTNSRTISTSIAAPRPAQNNTDSWVEMHRDASNPTGRTEIHMGFENNAKANWEVLSMPAWLSAQAQSGTTLEPLVIYANNNVLEGTMNDEFRVRIHVPGDIKEYTYSAYMLVEKMRLQPSRRSFAFSDYATQLEQHGAFTFNQILRENNVPLDITLSAESNQDWLVIDKAGLTDGVEFHLVTDALENGFHLASIQLSDQTNPLVEPAWVNIGYYKSAIPLAEGSSELIDLKYMKFRGKDALGPWIYLSGYENNTVSVYNYHSMILEEPIVFEGLHAISQLVFSDDGRLVAAHDWSSSNVAVYDLREKQIVKLFEDIHVGEESSLDFVRVGGNLLLHIGSDWYAVDNYEKLDKQVLGTFTAGPHFTSLGVVNQTYLSCDYSFPPFGIDRARNRLYVNSGENPLSYICAQDEYYWYPRFHALFTYDYDRQKIEFYDNDPYGELAFLDAIELGENDALIDAALGLNEERILSLILRDEDVETQVIRVYKKHLLDFTDIMIPEAVDELVYMIVPADGKAILYRDGNEDFTASRIVTHLYDN